jgi:hypothetical protein
VGKRGRLREKEQDSPEWRRLAGGDDRWVHRGGVVGGAVRGSIDLNRGSGTPAPFCAWNPTPRRRRRSCSRSVSGTDRVQLLFPRLSQVWSMCRRVGLDGSVADGNTGASPMPLDGAVLRASAAAGVSAVTVDLPALSSSARHVTVSSGRSTSDHRSPSLQRRSVR